MVSAVCPNCNIILVEANSATMADLGAAENEAVALGAKFVSNSWGGGESSSQTSDDTSYVKRASPSPLICGVSTATIWPVSRPNLFAARPL
ncbi:hypothetical protein SALBM311S_02843 [Streptomyces alboniger]